jgi:phosphohistidine swiveling domain-containing protein
MADTEISGAVLAMQADVDPPAQDEAPNPVHARTRPDTRWTRVNFAEAIQGVQTPMGWTFWSYAMEASVVRTFFDMGTLRGPRLPQGLADDGFAASFYGQAAGNVDVFHYVGDRMPGSSGDIVVEKLLGKVAESPSKRPRSAFARFPIVAVKLPRAAMRAARMLPEKQAAAGDWWRQAVLDAPPTDLPSAQSLLAEAARRFIDVGVHHATVSMLGNGLLDQLAELSTAATGSPSLAMDLATGYGGMHEVGLIEDLWSASTGELALDEVIRRHGYHGPQEGNLASRSWREDPAPLKAVIASYTRTGVESPRARESRQAQRRAEAETELLAGLSAAKRPPARFVLRLAQRYIPLREVGKSGFLYTLDAARLAARTGGRILADRGLLDDPEDVFFLTYDEFLKLPEGEAGLRDLVEERRRRHERYEALELPPYWTGKPAPTAAAITSDDAEPSSDGTAVELHGIGVVGDRVTGRARVVTDPAMAELDDGDILVCVTTDPSWTPLFMIAGALVIDTGGAMSHGAIVARELGVTCVINTGDGTRRIPDGATITVDGRQGLVTVDS